MGGSAYGGDSRAVDCAGAFDWVILVFQIAVDATCVVGR